MFHAFCSERVLTVEGGPPGGGDTAADQRTQRVSEALCENRSRSQVGIPALTAQTNANLLALAGDGGRVLAAAIGVKDCSLGHEA